MLAPNYHIIPIFSVKRWQYDHDHLLMSVSTYNTKINVLGAWEPQDKAGAMATWWLFLLAHVSPSCP